MYNLPLTSPAGVRMSAQKLFCHKTWKQVLRRSTNNHALYPSKKKNLLDDGAL